MSARELLVVTALLVAGCASLLLPPPGLLALALAAACLCPMHPHAEAAVRSVGASPRARTISGVLLLLVAVPANLALGGQLDGHLVTHSDFHTYLVGAEVGLRHGWSALFDVEVQRRTWLGSYGGDARFLPFLNTPPQAWMVAPLVALPYVWAYGIWVTLMLALTALVLMLVSRPSGNWRVAMLLMAGATWTVTYSLASGQNAIFGALAIVLCWRLVQAGQRSWAGVALGLVAIRPNATFLVPLALLVAGERRVFAAWLATTVVVGAVILISLGSHGVEQFVNLAIVVRRDFPKAVEMTLQQLMGPGPATVALQALLAGAALAAAWRVGRGRPALAISAGVVGSAFVTPYIHVQDYLTLLVAAGMVVSAAEREGAGWVLTALLVVAPPGWVFGSRWPFFLVLVELGWLAWLTWPEPSHRYGLTPDSSARRILGS
ncbi:MAG: glycosyltransferase family 87 protein [Candidatus Dormibacteria bacterium]